MPQVWSERVASLGEIRWVAPVLKLIGPSNNRRKMKVTLNWLKQYVDFNWSPEELTERLTMFGLEGEGVQSGCV